MIREWRRKSSAKLNCFGFSSDRATAALRSFVAVALALGLASCASEHDIIDDSGGHVGDYIHRRKALDELSEPVRILGRCLSACTLLLRARDVCVAPNAQLGFHAPWDDHGVHPEAVDYMASAYKPALRKLFYAHVRNGGGVSHGPYLMLSGRQLATLGYSLCRLDTLPESKVRRVGRHNIFFQTSHRH